MWKIHLDLFPYYFFEIYQYVDARSALSSEPKLKCKVEWYFVRYLLSHYQHLLKHYRAWLLEVTSFLKSLYSYHDVLLVTVISPGFQAAAIQLIYCSKWKINVRIWLYNFAVLVWLTWKCIRPFYCAPLQVACANSIGTQLIISRRERFKRSSLILSA